MSFSSSTFFDREGFVEVIARLSLRKPKNRVFPYVMVAIGFLVEIGILVDESMFQNEENTRTKEDFDAKYKGTILESNSYLNGMVRNLSPIQIFQMVPNGVIIVIILTYVGMFCIIVLTLGKFNKCRGTSDNKGFRTGVPTYFKYLVEIIYYYDYIFIFNGELFFRGITCIKNTPSKNNFEIDEATGEKIYFSITNTESSLKKGLECSSSQNYIIIIFVSIIMIINIILKGVSVFLQSIQPNPTLITSKKVTSDYVYSISIVLMMGVKMFLLNFADSIPLKIDLFYLFGTGVIIFCTICHIIYQMYYNNLMNILRLIKFVALLTLSVSIFVVRKEYVHINFPSKIYAIIVILFGITILTKILLNFWKLKKKSIQNILKNGNLNLNLSPSQLQDVTYGGLNYVYRALHYGSKKQPGFSSPKGISFVNPIIQLDDLNTLGFFCSEEFSKSMRNMKFNPIHEDKFVQAKFLGNNSHGLYENSNTSKKRSRISKRKVPVVINKKNARPKNKSIKDALREGNLKKIPRGMISGKNTSLGLMTYNKSQVNQYPGTSTEQLNLKSIDFKKFGVKNNLTEKSSFESKELINSQISLDSIVGVKKTEKQVIDFAAYSTLDLFEESKLKWIKFFIFGLEGILFQKLDLLLKSKRSNMKDVMKVYNMWMNINTIFLGKIGKAAFMSQKIVAWIRSKSSQNSGLGMETLNRSSLKKLNDNSITTSILIETGSLIIQNNLSTGDTILPEVRSSLTFKDKKENSSTLLHCGSFFNDYKNLKANITQIIKMKNQFYFNLDINGCDNKNVFKASEKFGNLDKIIGSQLKDLQIIARERFCSLLFVHSNYLNYIKHDTLRSLQMLSSLRSKAFLRNTTYIFGLRKKKHDSLVIFGLSAEIKNLGEINLISMNISEVGNYVNSEMLGQNISMVQPYPFNECHNMIMDPRTGTGMNYERKSSFITYFKVKSGHIVPFESSPKINYNIGSGLQYISSALFYPFESNEIFLILDETDKIREMSLKATNYFESYDHIEKYIDDITIDLRDLDEVAEAYLSTPNFNFSNTSFDRDMAKRLGTFSKLKAGKNVDLILP